MCGYNMTILHPILITNRIPEFLLWILLDWSWRTMGLTFPFIISHLLHFFFWRYMKVLVYQEKLQAGSEPVVLFAYGTILRAYKRQQVLLYAG
jgi:hypothetical protein